MPEGSVRFTLDDGEMLTVPDADLQPVYELLWRLAPKSGSVSMAAVIRDASRQSARYGAPLELTASQSAVLCEAVALHHNEGPSSG